MQQLPADIETLERSGYRVDEILNHQDIVPFIIRYLKFRTVFTSGFIAVNCIFSLLLILLCLYAGIYADFGFGTVFLWFANGCAATLLLVPLHEGLHGIAYKMCGAPSVTFEAHWRKLYFTANADKFVIGRSAFYFVGLAPFIIISLLLISALPLVPLHYKIMLATVLTIHSGMCAGDFGLLSYFASRKEKEVISFDDMTAKRSYFLVR